MFGCLEPELYDMVSGPPSKCSSRSTAASSAYPDPGRCSRLLTAGREVLLFDSRSCTRGSVVAVCLDPSDARGSSRCFREPSLLEHHPVSGTAGDPTTRGRTRVS